ncbi:MAG: metal-dependent hydrolase, partial [Propionibacteriales bacterium]|nr:metal-dependent hydrolase [Propionibacteriales bacterium]
MLKRLIAAVATAVLATATMIIPANAETSPRERELRVMSYNMHHAAGTDGVLSLERIAGEITTAGAEVIGLQEV